MSTCTFFGHRQCPSALRPQLREVLVDLIEGQGVHTFYVGNQGNFDHLVYSVLRELCQEYPGITYGVVLAYLPTERQDRGEQAVDDSHTMFPEGIETVPKRFAIDWRNRWMLKRADYVVTYVTHSWGGAAKFAEQARRMGKRVVNLDLPSSMGPYRGRL